MWSLHPRYLDRQGLLACWRESLLAQKVLAGQTKGYRNHPQLQRFRDAPDETAAIGRYLAGLAAEASARGYTFDATKIARPGGALNEIDATEQIEVTDGQLDFEWRHLLAKLRDRSPDVATRWSGVKRPEPHPLFRVVPGAVAPWERP